MTDSVDEGAPPIGHDLRKLRLSARMSLHQVSKESGLASTTVGSYERGTRTPPYDTVVALLRIYGHRIAIVPADMPVPGEAPSGAQPDRPDLCRKGHPFTPENTIVHPSGVRRCRTCRDASHQSWRRPADKPLPAACRNGHPYTEDNVVVWERKGRITCRQCQREAHARYRARKRQQRD